jgi:GntR family transcriptional regulator, transcriptional repressor for pyruvate dehydrogenase complex
MMSDMSKTLDDREGSGPARSWEIEPATRLADRLYDRLVQLIESGEFGDGGKLPPEHELAAKFNVSRPLIREALSRLREKEIIVSRKGVGSFVRQIPGRLEEESEVGAGFPSISSLSHVQKCYDFRIALEGDAAFFAARNRSDKELTALRDALGRLEEAIAAANLGTDADYDFHATVAHCSENPFFVKAARMMREPVRFAINLSRSLSLARPATRLRIVQAEHIAIFEAIASRNAEEARSAMRSHLSNACSRIFEGQRQE